MGSSSSRMTSPSTSSERQLARYDDQVAGQARRHDKTDFTSASALIPHIQPGDLIQQKGDSFKEWFYSHWAVYIGNGEIVHVTEVDGSPAKADIIREDMVSVFQGKNVRKNNHMDEYWPPRDRREIVRTARRSVGSPWQYNLITKNCEHFASFCRYGREISLQSLGITDIISRKVTLVEYRFYVNKVVKEKCSTFVSWIKRKVVQYLPAIAGGSHAAIGY